MTALRRTIYTLCQPRAQLALVTLASCVQKYPALIRWATHSQAAVKPAIEVLRKAGLALASFNGLHALSGATTADYETQPEAPLTVNVGDEVLFVFGVQNTEASARSWSVSGELPPGLTASGTQGAALSNGVFNNQFGQITGTPTQAGVYTVSLQPWSGQNGTGHTAEAFDLQITVVAAELVPPQASIERSDDQLVVTWSIQEGQSYEIQSSDNPLDPESWQTLPLTISTQNQSQSATLPQESLAPSLVIRVASGSL